MARLIVDSAGVSRSIPVTGETVIGRLKTCQAFVDDAKLSREHTRVTFDGRGYVVEDMGSRNGTFLNGQLLKGPAALRSGDRIKIGDTVLTFEADAPAAPAQASSPASTHRDSRPPHVRPTVVSTGPGPLARFTLTLFLLALLGAGIYGFRLAFLWAFRRMEGTTP